MKELKVARPVAEAEVERWAEAMALEFHEDQLDAEDKAAFTKQRNVLIDAICAGNLAVNDKGEFVFTPSSSPDQRITFHEPRGSDFMGTDNEKRGHDMKKSMMLLAAITRENVQTFSRMPNRDIRVCFAVQALFLG